MQTIRNIWGALLILTLSGTIYALFRAERTESHPGPSPIPNGVPSTTIGNISSVPGPPGPRSLLSASCKNSSGGSTVLTAVNSTGCPLPSTPSGTGSVIGRSGAPSCPAPRYSSPSPTLERLALVLFREAVGEGRTGMQAVAKVVLNRQKLEQQPLLRVLRCGAFASLRAGKIPKDLQQAKLDPQWNLALEIARQALEHPETLPNLVGASDHFDGIHRHPWWSRGQKPWVVLGRHKFWVLGRRPQAPS